MKRKKTLQARSSSGVCDAPHVRAGRCTAVSPSTAPVSQPNHTTSPTPPQRLIYLPHPSRQASKSSQAAQETHAAQNNFTHKAVDTYLYIYPVPLLRFSSSALIQLLYHPTTHSNGCTDIEKDASSIPITSPLSCLGDDKTNKQEGTLQAK